MKLWHLEVYVIFCLRYESGYWLTCYWTVAGHISLVVKYCRLHSYLAGGVAFRYAVFHYSQGRQSCSIVSVAFIFFFFL